MVTIDPASITPREMYKILIGSVIPRPIAFVSTLNSAGVGNLAPFSFYNAVSSNPPCLMLAISRRGGADEPKDTLKNIEDTGEFVVNSASEWLAEPLVYSAGDFPFGVDEMKITGLTPLPSVKVKPPRVKEAAVQFECKTFKLVDIGERAPGSTTLVLGRILLAHVHKRAFQDGRILPEELKPIARLGGLGYTKLGERFELSPPTVER